LMTLADQLAQEVTLAGMCLAASSIVGHALEVELVGYGDVDPAAETITVERDWTDGTVDTLLGTLHFRDFGSFVDDLKAGRTVVVQDCRTDARTVDHVPALEARGARAFVNMPIFEHGTFVAVLYVITASPRDWTVDELAFIRDVASRLRMAVSRVQAASAQDVLNQEISHRLKNTLAIVMSIAGQTFRSVPDQEPVHVFERRIQALSSAHDVLLRKNWASASAHEVVQTVLAAAGHAERIDMSGPDIDLGPSATLSLSLVLHELATNAVKYGALSVAEGRVAIEWSISGADQEAEVSMGWTERGGPGATDPAVSGRLGFGSRLIRRGLTGSGGVELHYAPTGFQSSMRARIAQLQGI
ncbi:MAG: GAF domain-containing protein, partial [Alphaproteobacteria bacterium]